MGRARSLLWLNDESRGIVHRVKFGGKFELLDVFRPVFEENFQLAFPDVDGVVPIPIHFRRWLKRGFNQSELLARWVSRSMQVPVLEYRLLKTKLTAPQSTLQEKERRRNLKASFSWTGEKPPRSVLLIDDIYTTGETLETCAGVLRKAGAEEVGAWTLFRTPRWS